MSENSRNKIDKKRSSRCFIINTKVVEKRTDEDSEWRCIKKGGQKSLPKTGFADCISRPKNIEWILFGACLKKLMPNYSIYFQR